MTIVKREEYNEILSISFRKLKSLNLNYILDVEHSKLRTNRTGHNSLYVRPPKRLASFYDFYTRTHKWRHTLTAALKEARGDLLCIWFENGVTCWDECIAAVYKEEQTRAGYIWLGGYPHTGLQW